MFANHVTHRRMLAAVLAFAAPAFVLTACNDDPLFDLPPDPPTNVTAAVQGNDVTIGWTPGTNATSQEVRVSPVVAVPLSAGNALQADDLVQVFNDNTTNTALFEDLDAGPYTATVTAINASSRAPSEIATFTIAGSSTTPTITSFTEVEGALVVEWTAIATAEAYHVTLTETDGGAVVEEIPDLATSPTSYTFAATPEAGVTYTAEVCAVFDLGASEDCGATVEYTVSENAAPVATIVMPMDAAQYFDTELIVFEGSATDAEDGDLTGASLVWTSDVDGELGTGETFEISASAATLGAHLITLTATDSNGLEGTAGVIIEIVEASSAQLYSVTFGPYFADNCTVCHGGASPSADVALDSWEGTVRSVSTSGAGGGPTIVIGDATMGVLIPKLEADHNNGPDDAVIVTGLTEWINDGAPNN